MCLGGLAACLRVQCFCRRSAAVTVAVTMTACLLARSASASPPRWWLATLPMSSTAAHHIGPLSRQPVCASVCTRLPARDRPPLLDVDGLLGGPRCLHHPRRPIPYMTYNVLWPWLHPPSLRSQVVPSAITSGPGDHGCQCHSQGRRRDAAAVPCAPPASRTAGHGV